MKVTAPGLVERCRGRYFITVRSLILFLLIFALSVANSAGLAAAVCEHGDAAAHFTSTRSDDRGVAVDAQSEESAAAAAGKKGTSGDTGGSLSIFLLPDQTVAAPTLASRSLLAPPGRSPPLTGIAQPPLLEPPLA